MKQKLIFLVVGIWYALFGYGLFAGLYVLLGQDIHYLVILMMSHALSVTNAFFGHRFLVFRSQDPISRECIRFSVSYVGTLLPGFFGMPVLVEMFGEYPVMAQADLLVMGPVYSRLAHKYYSFQPGSPALVVDGVKP